ncbi:hypothetical protein SLS62_004860 [Diatrype stigma]|uniref:Uncharacterized protein n=1 Tax=Diatrype stigma TaxID=117547 RepID=A0AAN9UPZ5_9PEZI
MEAIYIVDSVPGWVSQHLAPDGDGASFLSRILDSSLRLGSSLAAAFQSAMYGAFTPAGGLFATMTSLGILGWLAPLVTAVAALLALIPAGLVFGLVQD